MEKIEGKRWLTGEPDEYQDPAAAAGYQVTMLLRDFLAAGGTFGRPVVLELAMEPMTQGRVSRRRLSARLRGWGRSPSSSSVTTASSDS